jgi:antitoxin VapB
LRYTKKEAFIVQPKIAKLFMNGRSQAVRLPKEFRFAGEEVLIRKEGQNIILSPRPSSWDAFFKETPLPSEDFMATREDRPPQSREDLF